MLFDLEVRMPLRCLDTDNFRFRATLRCPGWLGAYTEACQESWSMIDQKAVTQLNFLQCSHCLWTRDIINSTQWVDDVPGFSRHHQLIALIFQCNLANSTLNLLTENCKYPFEQGCSSLFESCYSNLISGSSFCMMLMWFFSLTIWLQTWLCFHSVLLWLSLGFQFRACWVPFTGLCFRLLSPIRF